MKNILKITFILFIFLSCEEKKEELAVINETPKNGLLESFYPDGKLWSTCTYKNGLKHGKTSSYYPNGKLRYVGFYKEDKKADVWFFYNENGEFEKEVNFDNETTP